MTTTYTLLDAATATPATLDAALTKREALVAIIDREQYLAVQAWRKLHRDIEALQEQLHEVAQELKALPEAADLADQSYADVAALAESLVGRGLIEVPDVLFIEDDTDDGTALVVEVSR